MPDWIGSERVEFSLQFSLELSSPQIGNFNLVAAASQKILRIGLLRPLGPAYPLLGDAYLIPGACRTGSPSLSRPIFRPWFCRAGRLLPGLSAVTYCLLLYVTFCSGVHPMRRGGRALFCVSCYIEKKKTSSRTSPTVPDARVPSSSCSRQNG